MRPNGIHLLLTYKCNASCGHCFLSCGPRRKGVMAADEAIEYMDDSLKAGYISHFFVEGGEPFLYPETLTSVVEAAKERGIWIGALTNGFWAFSEAKAKETLAPLARAGLASLGISTDAWHSEFVPVENAERAAKTATALGIEADLMVCRGGPTSEAVLAGLLRDGFGFHAGNVVCRGRAADSSACASPEKDWRALSTCHATFGGDSRVHIGPFGEIHLCQGLLLGEDAREKPLADIFASFDPARHPICSALGEGGPAALARFAADYGFKPSERYTDSCQLCFEARRHLQPYFPDLLGPAEVYEDSAERNPATRGLGERGTEERKRGRGETAKRGKGVRH